MRLARLLFDLHRANGVDVLPAGTVLRASDANATTDKLLLPGGGYAVVSLDDIETFSGDPGDYPGLATTTPT